MSVSYFTFTAVGVVRITFITSAFTQLLSFPPILGIVVHGPAAPALQPFCHHSLWGWREAVGPENPEVRPALGRRLQVGARRRQAGGTQAHGLGVSELTVTPFCQIQRGRGAPVRAEHSKESRIRTPSGSPRLGC